MSMVIPFPGTFEREPGYDVLDGVEGPDEDALVAIEDEELEYDDFDMWYESTPEDWELLSDGFESDLWDDEYRE